MALSKNTTTGLTEDGKLMYYTTSNRSFTAEQLSEWGSLGGRPRWTEEMYIEAAGLLLSWFQESDDNIFISDFEKRYNINTDYIFPYYQEKHEECENPRFVEIIKKCKQAQEENILKGTWDKPGRTGIAAFWLKNKRGWRDQTTVEVQNVIPFALNFNLLEGQRKTPIQIEHEEPTAVKLQPPQQVPDPLPDSAPKGNTAPNEAKETPE